MTQPLRKNELPHERPGRPPRALNLVREVTPELAVDWSSWRLTDEEDMGQNPVQARAIQLLAESVPVRLAELGRGDAFVGTDAFFAWVPSEPLVRVSPDVYVLPRRPEPMPDSFQTWLPGHVAPMLAVEITSRDWQKDYELNPAKYAQLGVTELIIFDPRGTEGQRVALQVYRKSDDGVFSKAYAGPGPAYCRTLNAYAVTSQDEDWAPVMRFTYDAAGERLVPTQAEFARHERDRAEHERDRAEHERDEERRRREAAEARIRELEAALSAKG